MATQSEPGHWLLRGIQSAIFYYISCSPCLEYKYNKKRRREAKEASHAVVTTEPGVIRQPTAFETNEQWAEELILGPGPPKQWKPDEILAKVKQKLKSSTQDTPRPSTDRRLSNTFENVKESLRTSLHPEKWNWKRYDREDEVLWGLGDKVTKIWDKVTNVYQEEQAGRKRVHTNGSGGDYTRGRISALNDLHPAVVSQLPATREEAAWMLLPPPSAAVMNGKQRPGYEMGRKPLCVIGRPLPEPVLEIDVQTPEMTTVYSHQRRLSDPTPQSRPTDLRHFSEPVQLLRPPATVPTEVATGYFDTKSDILPLAGNITPKSRPASWQFLIIPTQ